jgi:hypothetical protein
VPVLDRSFHIRGAARCAPSPQDLGAGLYLLLDRPMPDPKAATVLFRKLLTTSASAYAPCDPGEKKGGHRAALFLAFLVNC